MRKILSLLIVLLFLFVAFAVPASAAAADIYDFNFNENDITFAESGFDSYFICQYGSNWYVIYFNAANYTGVTADGANYVVTTGTNSYYRIVAGNSPFLMFAKYAGVSDCSSLIDGSYPRTSDFFTARKTTKFFMTNCTQLKADLLDIGLIVYSDYKIFYNNVDDKEYTVYSLYTTSAGYGVTISTDKVKFDTSKLTLSATENKLYNFFFSSEEAAVNFLLSGDYTGMVSCGVGNVSNVNNFIFSSTYVVDQSGNMYFESYPIQAPEGGSDSGDDSGWFASLIGAVNNLGDNIAGFFNSFKDFITDFFSYPVDWVQSKVSELLSRFRFVENIMVFGDMFMDFLESEHNTPPTININFGNAESKYNWGGTVGTLDFSWYTKTWTKSGICLKNIGDFLISAFLILGFMWNLYKNLPNLISGGSMITNKISAARTKVSSHNPKNGGANK